jgi:hypothetical protein
MIRVLLAIAALLVALGITAWIAGSMLPVAHEATSSATFTATPGVLYEIIADRDRYREWWDDDTPTIVVESRPPERLVTRIADGLPFGGTWTVEVAPEGAGARVTITERGEVYNPIFRVLSRYVVGHTATMDRFLAALAARTSSLP